MLTEVNLPWYTAGLSRGLESCPGPIQEFVRVWTSEEDQHATLLESYLLFTESGDLSALAMRWDDKCCVSSYTMGGFIHARWADLFTFSWSSRWSGS